MLRQTILYQLPKTAVTLFAKQAPMLSIQMPRSDIAPQTSPPFLMETTRNISISYRLAKHKSKSGRNDLDSDSDDDAEEKFEDEKDSKVLKVKVNSLRADMLLKAALGTARNKIENMFYESRIRLNGEKLPKKSVQLNVGDELDVIRGFSQQNPTFLMISRVILLSASEREEGYSVALRRYKNLLIENYSGINAFKSSSVSDH